MRLIMVVLGLVLMVFLLAGCQSAKSQSPITPMEQAVKKRTLFTKGIPQKLQGTYYRTVITDVPNENDEFWELKIEKNTFRLKRLDEDMYKIDEANVETHQVSDHAYVLKAYDRYFKAVVLPDKKVDISTETFYDYQTARYDQRVVTLDAQKPDGYFGIIPQDLWGQIYVSERGIERYYSFNKLPMGSVLMKYDSTGQEHLIEQYGILKSKIGGYVLGHPMTDDQEILIPLSKTQLKNPQTGEVFTLYPEDRTHLENDVREKFGLGPKMIEIPTRSTTAKADKRSSEDQYPKTFDFADDKDDDYYDTYDDFDLNDGD